MFESVTCTGQFQTDEDGKELHVKISKAEVISVELSLEITYIDDTLLQDMQEDWSQLTDR